jgi:hypothetical protein
MTEIPAFNEPGHPPEPAPAPQPESAPQPAPEPARSFSPKPRPRALAPLQPARPSSIAQAA